MQPLRDALSPDGKPRAPAPVERRAAARRALHASEERQRLLFEGNPLPLWVFDARTLRFLDVNDAACEKYGYSRAEFLAMGICDIRSPEDAERLQQMVDDHRPGRHNRGEWTHRLRDGTEIVVSVITREVELDGRRAIFVCPIDVTARVRAEAELRERKRRFADMLDHVRQVAIMLDTEGRISYCNDYLLELTGWSREEVLGRDWIEAFMPPGFDEARTLFASLLANDASTWHLENDILTRTGERRSIEWNNTVLRSATGEVVGTASLGVDVTESRRSQAALRESEERLRLLLESTSEAIYGVDPQGLCTFVNPACARILGYASAQALIGKDMHALMHHSHADGTAYPREACRIYRAYRQGEGVHEEGEVFWRSDGTCFPAEYWSYPIRRDGRTLGAVVAFLDVTERKAAERRVRELNADLERRVAERTAELEAANAELQAFDYSIAHDLRAPLTRMRGFASALLLGDGGGLDARGRDYVERIVRAASSMDELVGDLLQLSLVSRQELTRDQVDVCALARSILDALARASPGRLVEVVVAEALSIRADARLLRIALENLIGNAWKFTSRTPSARIEVGMRGREVYVADNGAGFDPAGARRLFTPFQRLHSQSDFEGTGIGLAIVHRIVQRHGGRISAESAPGAGATFRFSLAA